MPVQIENLTNRPVMLRFNSGQTIYLGPKVTSEEIMDLEVEDNRKVQTLQNRHIITIEKVEKKYLKPTKKSKKRKSKVRV